MPTNAENAPGSFSPLRLDEPIYGELLARIQNGEYPRGSKLPTELVLAQLFEVSRPVIRVALARLREAGLIVSKRGSGSYVTSDPSQTSASAVMGSVSDIAAYYEYRIAIECPAAAMAASNSDRELLKPLRETLDSMDRRGETELTTEDDITFHALIAKMSGNRFFFEGLQSLRPHNLFVARFVRSMNPSGYDPAQVGMRSEHLQIFEAIARRDAAGASRLMGEHIRASEKRVFKGRT